jgi:recombination protein RecR
MNSFNRLIELFRRFPGIGPRQAERFAYFLISEPNSYIKELVHELENLKTESKVCSSCYRYYPKNKSESDLCAICNDKNRDLSKLLIISHERDLENIEKTHSYDGMYFVLGGTLPILEKEPEKHIRINELISIIEKRTQNLKEVVMAMSATTEGEHTAEFVIERIKQLSEKNKFKISQLGRGLSTGSELEYSDSDTIKNALKNRA